MYGEKLAYTLIYYLADSTIRILESHAKNDGRDRFAAFVERCRLAKDWHRQAGGGLQALAGRSGAATAAGGADAQGATTTTTVTSSSTAAAGGDGDAAAAAATAAVAGGESDDEYYGPRDLVIGSTLDIYNRKMRITACDSFTRDYYASSSSSSAGLPTQPPNEPLDPPPAPPAKREPPPHSTTTDIGSEEDSLGSFYNIGLPPYRNTANGRDLRKFIELDGKVLRFEARLDTGLPNDADRLLIIAFYLADDTQSIYEVTDKNSGFVGGKFLERGRYKNTGASGGGEDRNFAIGDFKVGATVQFVSSINLRIFSADNYTKKWLRENGYDTGGEAAGEAPVAEAAVAAVAGGEQ